MSNISTNGHRSLGYEESPDLWIVERLTPFDSYHHGVREILMTKRTKYQSMIIADIGTYGKSLFLDGKIQTTEGDEAYYHEPIVHVPSLVHGAPQSVLILGGADGGAAREALRWKSVQRVVVVDIDGDVVKGCKEYLPSIADGAFDDPRCTLVIGDALDYIGRNSEPFDVIVCDLSDPMENSPSLLLFTAEFFGKLSKNLSPNGAISIQAGPISLRENPTLFPRICNTLSTLFKTVIPIQSFIPTYGSPLGFAIATLRDASLPPPEAIDNIFKENLATKLHVLDGIACQGLLGVPRCVRNAIEDERAVLTEEEVARVFGHGNLE